MPGDAPTRVRELAALAADPVRRRHSLVDGLAVAERALETAYRRLAATSRAGEIEGPGAEWLLDNYYLVERAFRTVYDGLPPEFERRLPCAAEMRAPVAYALARQLASALRYGLDAQAIMPLIEDFQATRPLSIAEVWALPLLLRIAVLEALAAAASALAPRDDAAAASAVPGTVADLAAPQRVARCIASLHALDTADWNAFFERVSATEGILRDDPAGVYARMSFATRDRYRKTVEELAAGSGRREESVAEEAVRRAREHRDERERHVGHHLIGEGRDALAAALGYRPSWVARARRFAVGRPAAVYLGSIAMIVAAHEAALVAALIAVGASVAGVLAAAVLAAVALTTVAVTVVNAIVTRALPPSALPQMDFDAGIPRACRTLIAVPVLLADAGEIAEVIARLELHWLASADPNVQIALLSDFADAAAETVPGDEALLRQAQNGIVALNARYASGGVAPFHLLHRRRRWNPAEGCWMGWERKRGKLRELNRRLAGDRESSFAMHVGDPGALEGVRFVITLDADTELPRDSARRLVATLAHPLNRAVFDTATGRVRAGYTILQPRIEVNPTSAGASWLARLFAGDTGLDLYARTVSDTYQDLFGDGIYIGKGIYDAAAFERSLAGRAPENRLLSHDLFEGIHGRVGFVSQVVLLEDYPPNYLSYARRLYRWARGDWQLVPWLCPRVPREGGGTTRNDLSLLARWKIIDNLRSALLAPSVFAFLLVAWVSLPRPGAWTVLALLTLAAPALTDAMGGLVAKGFRTAVAPAVRGVVHGLRRSSARWLLHVAFLPHRAALFADACLRTLYRLAVGERLLEWTPAAATARAVRGARARTRVWREMRFAPLVAVGVVVGAAAWRPSVLPVVLPLAVLWLASPEIALAVSAPRTRRIEPLAEDDVRALRVLARHTWRFFETFVGPADQWLPPDHYQESPRGDVARRTSPTNIAFLGLATVAAHDLGYVGPLDVALRLRNTFDSLLRMERHRGHLFNWYDTKTLAPLSPRYVSTVDSGNLAGALLAVKHACVAMRRAPVVGRARWDGLLDTIAALDDALEGAAHALGGPALAPARARVGACRRELMTLRTHERGWSEPLARLVESSCPEIEAGVLAVIEVAERTNAHDLIAELRAWSVQLRRDLVALRRDVELFVPWDAAIAHPPPFLDSARARDAWAEIVRAVPPRPPSLAELPAVCEPVLAAVAHVRDAVGEPARVWAAAAGTALARARDAAAALAGTLEDLARDAGALFAAVDFSWLYDDRRRLFCIGYNATVGEFDAHHYDLLASEARLASFLAIAKGDVPTEHWLHLGRPFGRVGEVTALLSWSGTMFEYLLPRLLLREADESMIGRAAAAAVEIQIAYARRHGIPWGFSECGYYRFDAHQSYQYRAFGVPELGFKRGLEDDLVVAPYACMLALSLAPRAVLHNLERLRALGARGAYGLYEAIDCTPARLPPHATSAVVRSFMAHHQGMILCSVHALLTDNALACHLHAEPAVRTAEALLFERPPTDAPLARTRPDAARHAAARRPSALTPWTPASHAAFRQAHVLSNGRYRVVATARAGWSAWGDVALTRARMDPTLDDGGGMRLYVRDLGRGVVWPATADDGEVRFEAHAAETRRRRHDLALVERVCVAAGDDVELREVTITNESGVRRRVEVTSYAEVVLGDAAADRRHPAFSKLFVESEYLPDLHALVFHRRRRSRNERSAWLVHLLASGERVTPGAYESARDAFLGRGGTLASPAALDGRRRHAGLTGATLDPIMSLSAVVELAPRASAALAYLLVAAESRERALELARRYRALDGLGFAFEVARRRAATEVAGAGVPPADLPVAQGVLSLLVFPHPALRAPADVLTQNSGGQASLWRHGVSGDLPILLLRVRRVEDAALLQRLLRQQRLWRGRGMPFDLVVLDEDPGGYAGEVTAALGRAITRAGADASAGRSGGVFVVVADRLTDAERTALLAAARIVLDPSRATLDQQIAAAGGETARLPPLVPSRAYVPPVEALDHDEILAFENGIGGFAADGREYVIRLRPGETTPAPWVNVIANPRFGCIVSESGGGYTWSENSGENRLTPWRNDPLRDEPGDVLYLRDEETAAVWSPTPRPAPAAASYEARHGAGYTTFRHRSHGLDQRVRIWVTPHDPVKVTALRLTNCLDRVRRVTITYYVEWLLGATRDGVQAFVVPEFDPALEVLLARSPWRDAFAERVAFVAASEKLHGLTADRAEFLGVDGTYAAPAALARIGLASTVRAGLDPCAALQVHVDLPPGATHDLHFVLGQGESRAQACALAARYRARGEIDAAWAGVGRQWDAILGAIEVHTPEPGLDVIVNRWLPYQIIASRLWGRTGYYQSSGAFGFRDQLQDVAALIHSTPALARAHLLEAARHQFEDGDVLHWWHPQGGGVRTRCSDDLLWLPFVVAHYVATTGDEAILSTPLPFVTGDPLRPEEDERYGLFAATERRASLYEHCLAALARGRTAGPHGLPLFGSGDWNDGMNRVGRGGRGESVWLGWFLYATLVRFAVLAERRADADRAAALRRDAETLRAALEASAWDGAWYRRGYYDDGTPLGSATSAECRIDALAQSWAVLSGAGSPARAGVAMASVRRHLVREDAGLILLFTPPFHAGGADPGYVAAYPPGVRENGGHYGHAAIWTMWALAELGDADLAVNLFVRTLPLHRTSTRAGAERYRVEPYVLAADVYGAEPWTGRGGWTWYTGAAGWAHRFVVEAILGVRREAGAWRIDPHLPRHWPGFELVLRDGATVLRVRVDNPRGAGRGVTRMVLDGAPLEPPLLPRLTGAASHELGVTLG